MIQIGDNVTAPKSLGNKLCRGLDLASGDINPLIVQIDIVKLHIGRVQAQRVGVMGVVEIEPGEVIPIGLKKPATPAGKTARCGWPR